MGKNLLTCAKRLRKNSTDTEQHLWYFLPAKRLNGYKFERQYVIGDYVQEILNILTPSP